MRKAFVISLTLLLVVGVTAAFAKAPAQLPHVVQGADITERPSPVDPNMATATSADTFVFGPWDFETSWQGWTSLDLNLNPSVYPHIQDLSLLPGSVGNGTLFTGLVEWTGTLGSNACGSKACFPGYDNQSNQLFFKSFAVTAGMTLNYAYRNQTEPGYDYTYVEIFKNGVGCPTLTGSGGYHFPGTTTDVDTVRTYTGNSEGTESVDLSPYVGQTVCIVFHSQSDGGYSDGDCFYDTTDGMFECDNVTVGADVTTWDAGANGWTFGKVEGLGNFAAREPLSGLPMADPCPANCGLAGQVVTIYDAVDPNFHAVNQNEGIVSTPIQLTQNPKYPVGSYVLQFDVYANLPLNQGNFYFWHVRYSPVEISDCSCLDPNDWSGWLDENTIYYGGGVPSCGTAFQFNLSAKVPGHATQLQVIVGVINYPYYTITPGGNQSPYFDNISLRASSPGAPAPVINPWAFLQDAYPEATPFSVAKSTAATIDDAENIMSGRNQTRLGDSSWVSVAMSCNATQKTEVDLLFKVQPGPCTNLTHPWWVAYAAQPKIASGPYAGFAVARMDTAISNSNPNAWTAGFATFMTAFNEAPADPTSTYGALGLGNWGGYTGGVEGVTMFPDNLFTPGTHIDYVYHTCYIPHAGDSYSPDTKYGDGDGNRVGALIGNQQWAPAGPYSGTGTFAYEVSVLPYTTTDGTTDCNNAQPRHCFLYMDGSDLRGSQYSIENAFRNLAIGWDRYDLGAPTSSMGNVFGSKYALSNYPLGHAPGPLPGLVNEVYKAILWQTGALNSTNFTWGSTTAKAAGDDVDLLVAWLTTTSDGKFLWVNGDGNAQFLNKTGNRIAFLNNNLGTSYVKSGYRLDNTTWGVDLTGQAGTCTATLTYGLRGNWCPQRRSYNEINAFAPGVVNWVYSRAPGVAANGGTQNVVTTGGFNYITQFDAWSLDQLRQFGINPPPAPSNNAGITHWAAQALSGCFTGCFPNLTLTSAEDPGAAMLENRLTARTPVAPGLVTINYSLKSAGHVSVRVYDVSGRLVSTVLDKNETAGAHDAVWNASAAKAGVYFYQIEANGFKSAKKIVLVQ